MKRALLRNVALYTRNLLQPPPPSLLFFNPNPRLITPLLFPLSSTTPSIFRFFSSSSDENDANSNQNPDPVPQSTSAEPQIKDHDDFLDSIEDVSNKELKVQIEKYFDDGDEEVLPKIFESILKRKLKEKHDDTDDELLEELQVTPLDDIDNEEFESDLEDLEEEETDEEIENLYDARDVVMKRMVENGTFNMDERKWDESIKQAIVDEEHDDTKECEEILEDMLMWENVIPDSIKKKIKEKYNEVADMVETGDLTPEQGYDIYQKFEDKMIKESVKLMEKYGPPHDAVPDKKRDLKDPPGEGPILRWQTRVVFAPGGDAWHPKNRKVKLSVTVKELGLSKHQFRRLRELVGKRYNPGKDELTITSERFEHREENRKDCLRTLFSLIEEAGKARVLVEDEWTLHFKNRLGANDKFMERLRANKMKKEASASFAVCAEHHNLQKVIDKIK